MFSSKERHGNKKTGSRSTAKSQGSVAQGAAADTMPNNFGFLFKMDFVKANYSKKPKDIHNIGASTPEGNNRNNNIAKIWFPPTRTKQFRHNRSSALYRWRMGRVEVVDDMDPPRSKYDVASIFFQARQDNFVVGHWDCLVTKIKDEDNGWGYIGFHHQEGKVSRVDFAGSEFTVAAPACESTWMPQVLPYVYDYNTSDPDIPSPSDKCGGLCGKLAILIGMAAFSTEEDAAEAAVSKCFGLGTWREHGSKTGIGRYEGRGIVVSIYLDPDARGVTKEDLKAFENGKYGPIWGCNQSTPDTSEQSTSSRPATYPAAGLYGGYPPPTPYTTSYSYSNTSTFQPASRAMDPSEGAQDDEEQEPEGEFDGGT